MIVEELYLKISGSLKELDLNSPSGITLKYKNNLFVDLSKVTASHSYTITLPFTTNNSNVLGLAEDVRSTAMSKRIKYDALYLRNGVAVCKNANFYIISVTKDGYNCALTWDVCEGLRKLQENDCKLTELREKFGGKEIEDDELTLDANGRATGTAHWEQDSLQEDPATFDNTKNVQYPMYNAGRQYYWPIRDQYTELIKVSNFYPRPVMPVYFLLKQIEKAFGTKIKLGKACKGIGEEFTFVSDITGDDIVTYGALPLVGSGLTQRQLEQRGFSFDISSFAVPNYDDYGFVDFTDKGNTTKEEEKKHFIPLKVRSQSAATTLKTYYYTLDIDNPKQEWNKGNLFLEKDILSDLKSRAYPIAFACGLGLRFDGSVTVETRISTTETVDKSAITLHVSKLTLDGHPSRKAIYVSKAEDVASVDCTRAYAVGDKWWFEFNFQQAEGNENITCDEDGIYAFRISITTDGARDLKGASGTAITAIAEVDNMKKAHEIDTYTNLPDVSCMEFVKSLFFLSGAYPIINDNGELVARYYSNVLDNLEHRKYVDWSDRLLYTDNVRPEEIAFRVSDFAQKNFYLMGNEEEDASSKSDDTDVYRSDRFCIEMRDALAEQKATIIKLPFYNEYIRNKKMPREDVGNTVKAWDEKGEITEPKPAIGVCNYRTTQQTIINSDGESEMEDGGDPMLEFRIATLGSGQYAALESIMSNYVSVVENMNLTEQDLQELDYSRPVYLQKHNSFFVVSTIEVGSDGVSRVELIKLNTDAPATAGIFDETFDETFE